MSDDGVVFNYGNEFNENDERFKFDPNINFTDDELLRFMNLEISDDEDNDDDQKSGDDDEKHKTPVSPGLNFDKIKNKMENLGNNEKVIFYLFDFFILYLLKL